MTAELPTRRTVLTTGVAVAGAAAGAVALAACGSDSGSSSSSSSSGGTSSTAAATSGATVAALSDISVGGAKSVTVDGQAAIVSRPTETTAACFSAICTHQGCTVTPEADKLNCPCHSSVFNALTGEVEKGPAKTALPSIAVKVDGGNVVTA